MRLLLISLFLVNCGSLKPDVTVNNENTNHLEGVLRVRSFAISNESICQSEGSSIIQTLYRDLNGDGYWSEAEPTKMELLCTVDYLNKVFMTSDIFSFIDDEVLYFGLRGLNANCYYMETIVSDLPEGGAAIGGRTSISISTSIPTSEQVIAAIQHGYYINYIRSLNGAADPYSAYPIIKSKDGGVNIITGAAASLGDYNRTACLLDLEIEEI